jgi:hypothetical protein
MNSLKPIFRIASAALLAWSAAAMAQFVVPPLPTVEVPSGPGPVWSGLRPALTPGGEPGDFGYVTEEYFVSGTANNQPYKTRILVRRPADPERFSGIVVAESMHSNGFAVTFQPAMKSVLLRGHVHVEIAAQQGNVNNTIKPFNPERYATLSIPSVQQTSEIIAQVAMLLKSEPGNRRLLLQGTSQASSVLRTYQAAKHFPSRMADGSPIVDGYLATSTLGNAPMMVVDVPTVHMPTMTEANSAPAAGIGYRRGDSDEPATRYRLYEVAGMAHANSRDTISYVPNPCTLPVSDFPWGGAVAMGLQHLVEWVDRGVVPPSAAPIGFDNDTTSDGSRLALDAHGNVKGGVPSTYVDVPVAQYGVPNSAGFNCSIAGWRIQFSEETLRDLYKNKGSYISKLNRRLMELVREGWVLPEYTDEIRADAQAIGIPSPSGR